MENLNAEQIKYCLELILKSGIGMSRDDVDVTDIKRALSLITSQEQRIKELAEENERLIDAGFELSDFAIAKIRAVKADTVRKMQELLENRIKDKFSYHGWYLKETVIPGIAKEMVKE